MIAILYYFDWEIREGRGKTDRCFRFRERDETAKYLTFIRLFCIYDYTFVKQDASHALVIHKPIK